MSTAISQAMKIHIIHNNQLSREHLKQIKKQAKIILEHLNIPRKAEICISFTDDKTMRQLNKIYRRIDKATDVLSFPQHTTDLTPNVNTAIANLNNKTSPILGDIIISVNTAKKHAGIYRNTLEEEINKLLIHGSLHLLGYDHKRKKDAKLMREKEDELLSLLESV